MALLDDLDRRRERERQDRENSARLAQAFAIFDTTGLGSVENPDRISFGTTFIEKPFVAYGAEVDTEQIADEWGFNPEDEEDVLHIPLSMGYVTEWDRDERDFYVGCWVAVRIYYPDSELESGGGEVSGGFSPQIEVRHHFTFAANAMKDIPNMGPDEEAEQDGDE